MEQEQPTAPSQTQAKGRKIKRDQWVLAVEEIINELENKGASPEKAIKNAKEKITSFYAAETLPGQDLTRVV